MTRALFLLYICLLLVLVEVEQVLQITYTAFWFGFIKVRNLKLKCYGFFNCSIESIFLFPTWMSVKVLSFKNIRILFIYSKA